MRVPVAAVIPVFEPEVHELIRAADALVSEQIPVLIVDDGSRNPPSSKDFPASLIKFQRHANNAGIARSLNEGLRFALDHGAQWLLTLDQDTEIPAGYVPRLLEVANASIGVIGAEYICVGGIDLPYPSKWKNDYLITDEVFQSGSLWSVTSLRTIGGFDENLSIDAVDAAACLALREQGMRVALAPGTRVHHGYGSGRMVRVFGHSVMATNHSPARRETMIRNRLRLLPREFRQSPVQAMRTVRRLIVNTLLAVTIEEDRWAKAKASMRGLLPKTRR
jgi:rhamnosyltransferase